MVVIAATVLTVDGKVLVSRQFVDIAKSRIEGLLAAFAKLLSGADSTHTYVENNNVRYVYQRLHEDIYLTLVTNKSSNIVEDLEILQLLAKVVPEYCGGIVEEKIVLRNSFELIFAFDEAVSRGQKEKVTVAQIKTYTEMDSQEERIHEMLEKNKEREAAEEMKRRMKEVERERKEREKMGLPSFAGQGSRGGGGGNLNAISSTGGGYGGGSGYIEQSKPQSPASTPSSKVAPKPQRSGMKLGSKTNAPSTFMEQLAKEGEVTSAPPTISASGKGGQPSVAEVPAVREPIEVSVTEKMQVVFDREGVLTQFVIDGELNVNVTAEVAVKNRILVSNKSNLQFRTHPNINKNLFAEKNIIGLKDDQTAYRLNTPTAVLKWRHQSDREDDIPIRVHCWPSVSGDGSVVANIDYEATPGTEIVDFSLLVPIVGKGSPIVNTSDGSHQYDSKNNTLIWSIPLITDDNLKGEMSVEVAQWDGSNDTNWLFPIVVRFVGKSTFANINVEAAKVITGENVSTRVTKELKVEKYVIGERRA